MSANGAVKFTFSDASIARATGPPADRAARNGPRSGPRRQAAQLLAQQLREGLVFRMARGREVERDDRGLRAAGSRDGVVRGLEFFLVPAEERHGGAATRRFERDGAAEALAGARDQHDALAQQALCRDIAGGNVGFLVHRLLR